MENVRLKTHDTQTCSALTLRLRGILLRIAKGVDVVFAPASQDDRSFHELFACILLEEGLMDDGTG